MLKLLFVGDIAIQGDGKLCISDELKNKFQEYDLRVCNFEGAVGDIQTASPGSKAGPLLLQSQASYEATAPLKFDLFGLANNHILDFGKQCLVQTVTALERAGGEVIGVQCGAKKAYEPYIYEKDGMKIAFFSAAENSFGTINEHVSCGHAHLMSRELLVQIRKCKNCCDKIVLLAHAGLENLTVPMPEWIDAYKNFIDAGVDIIIGHHPHVVQGWERYGDGLIFYSLGNFLWQKRKRAFSDLKTMMVGVHIDDEQVTYEVIPVKVQDGELLLNDTDTEYGDFLNDCCRILEPNKKEELLRTVDTFCFDLYKSAFKDYIFSTCGCTVLRSKKDYIKSVLQSVLRKHSVNHNFIYHNAAVETNNWVMSRAIRTLQKDN